MSRTNGMRGDLFGLPLSKLEEQVLVAKVNHATEPAAAAALGLSRHTVQMYLRNIREKLGAETTTHAAALAYSSIGHRYQAGR